MRRALSVTVMAVGLALPAWAADKPMPPQPRPVARIDTLMAVQKGANVTIQAKGAVNGGGWRTAKLRPLKAGPGDARTLVVEFVATPPVPGHAEIAGLIPVAASISLRVPKGVVSVRAMSGFNEITTQILK